MAKVNVNFFKVFGLVTAVLTTVVKLVKEFVETNSSEEDPEE